MVNQYKILAKSFFSSFVVRFLLSFFLLYYFFVFFIGLVDPNPSGLLYSRFIDDHLNILNWLTGFITICAKLVLQALQYTVIQKNFYTINILHARGVSIQNACLGCGVMSFWIAFIFAHSTMWQHKIKWMLTGLTVIISINIIRIALIALANYYNWETITSLEPHQTFNIVSYCFIFLLTAWYVLVDKIQEKR